MSLEEMDPGPRVRAVVGLKDCVFGDGPPAQRIGEIQPEKIDWFSSGALLGRGTRLPGLTAIVGAVKLAARDTAECGVRKTHLLEGRVGGVKNLIPSGGCTRPPVNRKLTRRHH